MNQVPSGWLWGCGEAGAGNPWGREATSPASKSSPPGNRSSHPARHVFQFPKRVIFGWFFCGWWTETKTAFFSSSDSNVNRKMPDGLDFFFKNSFALCYSDIPNWVTDTKTDIQLLSVYKKNYLTLFQSTKHSIFLCKSGSSTLILVGVLICFITPHFSYTKISVRISTICMWIQSYIRHEGFSLSVCHPFWRLCYPVWFVKLVGLESSGQRLISSIGKTNRIDFFCEKTIVSNFSELLKKNVCWKNFGIFSFLLIFDVFQIFFFS